MYVPEQIEKIQRVFWTLPPGAVDVLQLLVIVTTHLPLPGALLGLALFVTLAVPAAAALARDAPRMLYRPGGGAVVLLCRSADRHHVRGILHYPSGLCASRGHRFIASVLFDPWIARCRASGWTRVAVGSAVAIVMVITYPSLYSAWGEWRRAPFAEADEFLRRRAQQGDLVLHDNKLAFFPMHYYDRNLPQAFLPDPPGSSNDTLAPVSQDALGLRPAQFEVVVAEHARVWFVIFQTALDQAQEEGHPHGNLARFGCGARVPRNHFFRRPEADAL